MSRLALSWRSRTMRCMGNKSAARSRAALVAGCATALAGLLASVLLPAGTAAAATISSGPSGTVASSTATFTFAGSDGEAFTCRLDQQAAVPCASPVTYTGLGAGVHAFTVSGTLVTGAPGGSDTRRWTISAGAEIDTVVTAGPADGSENPPTVYFSFSSDTDGASFACSADDGPWTACASPRTLAALPAGPHSFAVRAQAPDGAYDTTPARRVFTVGRWDLDPIAEEGQRGPCSEGSPTGREAVACAPQEVAFNTDTTLAPAREALSAIASLPATARTTAPPSVTGPWAGISQQVDRAAASLASEDPCRGAAALAAVAAAAGRAADAERAAAQGAVEEAYLAPPQGEERSDDSAVLAARQRERLSLRAAASLELAADDAQGVCAQLGSDITVRGTVVAIDWDTRRVTLSGGRTYYLPQRAGSAKTLRGQAPFDVGVKVRLRARPSLSGQSGWITGSDPVKLPDAPKPPQVACVSPRVEPVQPPASADYVRVNHPMTGYRTVDLKPADRNFYQFDQGTRILASASKCQKPGYTLAVLANGHVIADALHPGESVELSYPGLKKLTAGDVAKEVPLTIVLHWRPEGCQCKPSVVHSWSSTMAIGFPGARGGMSLDRQGFAVDTTGVSESATVSGYSLVWTKSPEATQLTASAYVLGTLVADVHPGSAILVRPKADYASWSSLPGAGASGLAWPRVTGTRGGGPFRYVASVDPIYTDMVSTCAEEPAQDHHDCAYRLPWLNNSTFKVTQGNGGSASHFDPKGQFYAFDFGLGEGTLLVATRNGVVGDVVESGSMTFNPCADNNGDGIAGDEEDRKVDGPSNYVRLDFPDGTFAYYAHIKKDGAVVAVGDSVQRGQLIAISGNTGRSCGPHLHYQVAATSEATIYGQTRPGKFVAAIDGQTVERYLPQAGDWLTAVPGP